jgi:hypothetical protein
VLTRRITLELDDFGRSVLSAPDERPATPPGALARAVEYYLADAGSGRFTWNYPDFLRDRPPTGAPSLMSVEIDPATWSAVRDEADRQRVSVERLVEHALFYYMAGSDPGRDPRRVGDDDPRRGSAAQAAHRVARSGIGWP